MLDPDRHARLEACRLSLRVEAQAQGIAVMIADHPLGLPGGEDPERLQFGDDGFGRTIGTVPHHARCFPDRKTTEMVFTDIEREPLLARSLDHQDRLPRMDIFAHLRGNDADSAGGWGASEGLF